MTELPPIAIPTYQRADILLTHTLAYLTEEKYPAEKIFIFVADEQECEVYRKKLPAGSYAQLVIGKVGLLNQRLLINQHFEQGKIICQMDDDVKGLKMLREGQTFLDLVRFACWTLTKGGGLFGVMPNDDRRKMEDRLTTHLSHVLGSFFICKNERECVPNIQEKEDYERSILYYRKYGSVYRWKGAGVITRYRGNPGGLQAFDRKPQMERAVRYLLDTYPEYCKERAKDDTADILLNWRASSSQQSQK